MLQLHSTWFLLEKISGGDPNFSTLMQFWVMIFAAVVILCFIVGELTRNYSQVDKLWSLMPIIYGWTSVAFYPSSLRLWLMAIVVTFWGLRLSYNFFRKRGYNIIPWKGEEDYRWKVMREHPKLRGRLRFGLFNLFFISFYQHFLIMLFSSPLLLAAKSQKSGLTMIDIIAASSMILFIVIEAIADNQQFRFHGQKHGSGNTGKQYIESLKNGFLTEGLWKYVRHPNFASEQAIWISFYFFGVAASGKWINLTIAGPVLLVLLFIGSTHLTERISCEKYPDYADYKKNVPKFLPRLFIKGY